MVVAVAATCKVAHHIAPEAAQEEVVESVPSHMRGRWVTDQFFREQTRLSRFGRLPLPSSPKPLKRTLMQSGCWTTL